MADARAMLLPLVTAGDSDYIEHDWHTIFSSLGVLQYDTKIAAVVSFLGWCGMLATVVWLVRRALDDVRAQAVSERAMPQQGAIRDSFTAIRSEAFRETSASPSDFSD